MSERVAPFQQQHEELVIGRRRQSQLHVLYDGREDGDGLQSTSLSGAYSAASPQTQGQHYQHQHQPSDLSCWSDSSPDEVMRMTAYESMFTPQQWSETQRTASRARAPRANSSNGTSSQHIPTHRVITPWGLLAIAFFVCCGGPVGTEPLAAAGGPLLGLVAQVAFPLLFNIPLLLAIAELATAFPNDGGYSVWVLNAFGPYWGYQVGFWSWLASIVDRVVYTHFLFDTLAAPLGYDGVSYGIAYAIKAGVAVVLTLPALFCTKTFIRALYIQLALVVLATLMLSGWGFSQTRSLAVFGETKPDQATLANHFADTESGAWKIDWAAYIGIFWYYDGFYLATVFGGEVAKPNKTYPRGLKWGIALTWLTYLLPMLAVVGAVSSWSSESTAEADGDKARWGHWSLLTEDSYPEIARAIGGQALYVIALVGLVAGAAGMYMAELFCQAYQMRGMAENDLLPAIFMRRHPTFGTPRMSMYFSTVVVLAVLPANFDSLYAAKDALSALVELFIIFAAVRLRQTQPFVSRSFKIPGGIPGMCTILLLPTLMLGYQVADQVRVLKPALVLLGVFVLGSLCSLMCVWVRNKRQQKSARRLMMAMAPTMMLSADLSSQDSAMVYLGK